MVRYETFHRYYNCDLPVSAQIANYCNKNGVTKDMIIYCKIDHATDGTVRESGSLVYEIQEEENG